MDAVQKSLGPCVILAGAGTGKTYTIVEKIKYLVENKIYKPENIVCITFSNEAANNLAVRAGKALDGFKMGKPVIRTFHGLSADILRKHGEKIGINKEFKILDPDQAKIMLHRSLRINAGNCHRYIGTIGTAKDLGIKIDNLWEYLEPKLKEFEGIDLSKKYEDLSFEFQTLHLKNDLGKKRELSQELEKVKGLIELKKFVNAWTAYEKLKKKGNYQDYSDLNTNALELLEKSPETAGEFSYVIVDEFQDTNKLQLDFLIRLASHGNITVVGDINQSIYRFRGAYKDNLVYFKKAFSVKESDIFTLTKSYRSSNKILRTAHRLISNNYSNPSECFFVESADSREGGNIEFYRMKNSREEARKAVELINSERKSGVSYEDICIIFRTHQQGRIIRQALEREKIPYVSVTKASLLKQKSIKTARDFLIILDKIRRNDNGGEDAWWDLIYQLGFPQEDLIKIGRAIKEFSGNGRQERRQKEADETKKNVNLSGHLMDGLVKLPLSEYGRIAATSLIEKINQMSGMIEKPISELIMEIYRIAGLINEQKTRQEKEIMLNLNKFYEIAKVHEELYDSDLNNFIYYLDILESLGIELSASSLEEEGVRLMTSHSTKGLEFKTVIITNFAQGKFPIERYTSNSLIPTELLPEIKDEIKLIGQEEIKSFISNYEKHHQLLEERRLAYVSFTRAKEKLYLTFSELYGSKKAYPSQFLDEIKYMGSKDINYVCDEDEKFKDFEVLIRPANEISQALYSNDIESAVAKIVKGDKSGKPEEKRRLSPSALILFSDCQKQFEYKYLFNMPDKKTISWEAMRLGSFVHTVLEKGVSAGFKSAEQFVAYAREISMDEDWGGIDIGEAETLVRVFFERNNGRYNEKSKTEQFLSLQLEGIDFLGYADRIDFSDKGIEIVDYKTGKTYISPRARNWQLGFYALAAKASYGLAVRKVILDMLKQEKPFEFEIDEKGNAVCKSSSYLDGFNIYEIEKELVETAKKVQDAYRSGFKPCPVEKNCEFCDEYVYGI